MITRTTKLAWKMILSGLFSASFLALALVPATTSAAVGDDCTDTKSCPTGGEVCIRNANDGTPGDATDAFSFVCTTPQATQYGLGEFTDVGLGQTQDLKGSIANIINIILGFLGIVAVIIILAGGFKWMTAGGNEDKVGESRQMIIQGIIGLVVVFAAWAIASFVVSNLQSATT
ncbi:MAG: hypothetical protein HYT31_04790 [Parcubacteria group bacterium]|nr:hypothetical protein [Parcubacteria group bacterium]